jgi:hypothetical protein
MAFTKNFTDPQGVEHLAAYFEASEASINVRKNESYNNRISVGEEEVGGNSGVDINYKMYYWTSEQAKLDGKLPYLLANVDPMGDIFNVYGLSVDEYGSMSAKEAAEHHCQTVVLV